MPTCMSDLHTGFKNIRVEAGDVRNVNDTDTSPILDRAVTAVSGNESRPSCAVSAE